MGIAQYAEEIFKGHTMRKEAYLDGYDYAVNKANKVFCETTCRGYRATKVCHVEGGMCDAKREFLKALE